MPTLTPRLGIKKPIGTENVNRASFNENYDIIDAAAAKKTDLDTHTANTSNPHNVTTTQIGAETPAGAQTKVDTHANRTDNPHAVTTTQIGAIPTSQKGAASGVATLDGSGTIPDAQIPAAITRDTELSAHTSRTDNPHSVTAAQIGAADLTSFVNSKAANGYQKLAGGLIIQWGVATLSGNTLSTVTLPIAFPTAFVSVTANAQNAPIFVSSLTTTNFQVFPSSANSQTVYWIAIGY